MSYTEVLVTYAARCFKLCGAQLCDAGGSLVDERFCVKNFVEISCRVLELDVAFRGEPVVAFV